MELFDTYFVQFGQVLDVSGQKTLAIRNRYVEVVKSQPHLGCFQLIPDQTEQNGYQTVPFSVYIHNLMFVLIFE